MYDLFFNVKYPGDTDFAIKVLAIAGLFVLLFWLLSLIMFNKKKKTDYSLAVRMKINTMNVVILFNFLIAAYMIILYVLNGYYQFNWEEFPFNTSNIYLRLLPFILIFLTGIILFAIMNSKITKSIKN